jgi:hypothetical protein
MSLSSIHKSTTKGNILDSINFSYNQYVAFIPHLSELIVPYISEFICPFF